MSVYLIKGKGWRYDFTLKGERYTQAGFKTKTMAKQAEAERRKEVLKPQKETQTPTDMGFLELVNRRLDHMKAYRSKAHYDDYRYRCKPWVRLWSHLTCSEITREMIQSFILKRSRVSACTANRDLVSLRSLFNFGKKHNRVNANPTEGIELLPVEKKVRYLPPLEDIFKVIAAADLDTQDYLWAIRETIARVSEVNRLTWDDVNLKEQSLILYTRKKRGSHLTPRKIPMTEHLHKILSRRYAQRDKRMPWVFWHSYTSRKTGEQCQGPYGRRKRLMQGLCKKAEVKYFNFHALRHSGASVMDNKGVPIGSIQRILGHESRRTTEKYLQSIGESERQAMAVFEEASKNSHTDSHTVVVSSEGQGG
ncbi:tyrosine-type recombinase/integrase [Acidobacteria bacterium AH-259-L09]|nr:tyrosine-type recombinase/integrase [Acidobacteria bacterium AH-259-L09]